MVYKKITIFAIIFAILAGVISNVTFAATSISTNDKILDTTLNILIFVQKYSWPVVTLVFVYALYQFYVIGSEVLEHKIVGQRLIVGIAIFMVIVQCLPLIYAFLTVK